MFKKSLLIIVLIIISYEGSFCQSADSTSFKLCSRLSFYSYEDSGEMLLHVPQYMIYNRIEVSLASGGNEFCRWNGVPGKKILRLPFNLSLQPSNYIADAAIKVSGRSTRYTASTELTILPYKPNEVKTDRFTGGLIVNKRIFFPFGFYTYTPVHPTLPEEEVVKGFNTISPYQRIIPSTFPMRKAYMDRCAQLGMKVHYNLLSVSGGGGVSSKIEGISEQQKKELLVSEIKAFRDHPALLAWYIADEPNGFKIHPDSLIQIYKLIKELDPWHPVSVVFMAPFMSSRQYADALDIVMADPYPVPGTPITIVGDVAGQLMSEFSGKKPVWIVPQAFGGGEWWEREPTLQELRSMTYQSIIKGARGIQYFVRQGLNLFPKSTSAWAECGRMAVEIAELTPWLLSDEETIAVRSGSKDIIVTSALHDGQLMIMAVNKTNAPQRADLSIARAVSTKAKVLFENRNVNVSGGFFSDQLSAFGSQVYLINLKTGKEPSARWKKNLIIDPGFEDSSSPGIPASCYARGGGDRGATYFPDSREHIEGNHSIRIITPTAGKSIKLRFFPFTGRNGAIYYISVWAKADQERGQYFEISLGDYGSTKFELTNDWQEYVTNVTIPYFNDQPPRTNIILQMLSAGVAWFDMLQAMECVDINRSINPELNPNDY
ncbi:MAG: hypothetical protein MUF36_07075 [Bacteroidales bacterium]|nr:hypothetical protein [Bacteroidales bacterium]